MTDAYRTIFEAFRSRLGDAFEYDMQRAALAFGSPSAVYRPCIKIDGNQWCALYGDDVQDGVSGFGDSPAEAMADFDKNWNAKLSEKPQ